MLECNPAGKKLILTLKKSLVQSKLPVLSSYEDAKPGLITHGFVVCAREFGCIVKFYNDVKGLVPKNELSSEPISCPDKVFHEGQVIHVPTCYLCLKAKEKSAAELASTWVFPWRNQLHQGMSMSIHFK